MITADAALRAARQGDLSAYNRLVLEHQTAVYNLAYRLLDDEDAATEATQAAFVGALRGLRAPGARQAGPFQLWVLRCLVQACRPLLGRHSGPTALPGGLAALPPAQSLALGLVDVAGLDYAQAAAVLGLSPAQLRCDLAAARRALLPALAAR